jgi:hypothetical protein
VNFRNVPECYGHLDSQPNHLRYKFARQVDFCPEAYLIKRDIFHKLAGFNEGYRTSSSAHRSRVPRASVRAFLSLLSKFASFQFLRRGLVRRLAR